MLRDLYRSIRYNDFGDRQITIIFLSSYVAAFVIGGILIYGLTHLTAPNNYEKTPQAQIVSGDLIKTTVANVKQQGKLVVTTMDVQTYNTSKKSGLMYTGEITTISQGKVLFTMNLHDFDENWISYQDNRILVVLPRNFLKAEIIETQSSEVENNGWLTPDDVVEELRTNNKNVNKTNMLSQVNGMLDMVRPNATKELENLFVIPLKATGQNVTVKVTFG